MKRKEPTYWIIFKIRPEINPIKYNEIKINRFCFIFFLFLNNIINPTPLPAESPAIKAGKIKALFKYNSIKTTLETQFGIKPIIGASTIWR